MPSPSCKGETQDGLRLDSDELSPTISSNQQKGKQKSNVSLLKCFMEPTVFLIKQYMPYKQKFGINSSILTLLYYFGSDCWTDGKRQALK